MTSAISPFVVANRHYSLDQVEAILQLCALLRLTAYHTHDSRRSPAGFPDLVIIGPGRPILFIECKAPWGKLTIGQRAWFRVALRSSTPAWFAVVRPQDWPALERVLRGDRP